MTSILQPLLATALRRAAVRATRAPSIHNTQPWRFVLNGSSLDIHADRSRQLRVIDPYGRQLMLSCGCAVFNARVALAGAGYEAEVERFPDLARPDFVARIEVAESPGSGGPALADLDTAIDVRQTNRREFSVDVVPQEVVDTLIDAGKVEGAEVFPIVRPKDRLTAARLSQEAEVIENADPAYRAELRAWTSDDPHRLDAVPSFAVPHVDAGSGDDVPIRDFDTRGAGALPTRTHSSLHQCLLLLGSVDNDLMAWLRAGEALERMLLEIARRGYAASPFTQVIEVRRTNELLRHELDLGMHPHIMVRVGRAPATPSTRRRRLVDVLTEAE